MVSRNNMPFMILLSRYLNRIQGQCGVIKVVCVTTFLWCLTNLMMALYTFVETCCSKILHEIAKRGFVISVSSSVRPSAWNGSAPTGWNFMKFGIWVFFFVNVSRKLKFPYNMTRIIGTLHEDRCTFLIISRLILLGIETISDKIL